jgi:glycosyltransferase involved in cell wall biosynthesis
MNKIKVAYIISNISKVIMFEWLSQAMNSSKFELYFIFLNDSEPEVVSYLRKNGFTCYVIPYKTKKHIPLATLKVMYFLFSNKIKILHAHLFDASIVGLLAAFILRLPKRIHTRHHSDFHHVYFPSAVKYDNLINWLSTDIIVVSKNVKEVLLSKEKYIKEKIRLIYHGFDLESFFCVKDERKIKMKEKWGIDFDSTIIGMVSRLIKLKCVDYSIHGFIKLYEENKNIQLIIANALGDKEYVKYIYSLTSNIPKDRIIFIDYEKDMPTLYHCFDIFLHVPEDPTCEAFGQVYIEAMAAKIPSVVTLSGIAVEYIVDNENALVVEYKNSESIFQKLKELIGNKTLKLKIAERGYQNVKSLFSLETMISQLEKLYSK